MWPSISDCMDRCITAQFVIFSYRNSLLLFRCFSSLGSTIYAIVPIEALFCVVAFLCLFFSFSFSSIWEMMGVSFDII